MTCNAVEPGAHDFPARCALRRDHDGPHRAGTGIVSMARVDPGVEWGEPPVGPDPAVSIWQRIFRRSA